MFEGDCMSKMPSKERDKQKVKLVCLHASARRWKAGQSSVGGDYERESGENQGRTQAVEDTEKGQAEDRRLPVTHGELHLRIQQIKAEEVEVGEARSNEDGCAQLASS
jgi:hypothetical protein